MKRRVNAKRIRNNALERYINESSFCYADIGFVGASEKHGAFFESRLLFEEYLTDAKEKDDDPIGAATIEPTFITLIAENDSPSATHHKSSNFISQNTDILKNRQFLRRYRKLYHRDKLALGFSIQI